MRECTICDFSSRAILSPRNDAVTLVNDKVLSLFRADQQDREFLSADSTTVTDNQAFMSPDVLNTFDFASIPPHRLRLKVGAPIIPIRNLNAQQGLCNGTRLVVVELFQRNIRARITTGSPEHIGRVVVIPRISLQPSENSLPFTMVRKQFPIRLAFALTINKAQGQTVQCCGVYLPCPVFGHGQLYMALSRSGSRDDVNIQVDQIESVQGTFSSHAGVFVQNVVYREVLL